MLISSNPNIVYFLKRRETAPSGASGDGWGGGDYPYHTRCVSKGLD